MKKFDDSVDTSGLKLGFLSGQVGYRIRLLQIAAFKDFEEITTGFGSAPRYFGLLCIIQANPGSSQTRLAEAIHLVRSSLVPILDKLEVEKLVERRPSPVDRRTNSVWLTPQGTKVIDKLQPLVVEHEERLIAGLSAAEQKQLLNFLKRADDNLRSRKAFSSET